ncbi:hypothetical protein HGO53_06850 [Wolbachia endosymbiont of Diaphorina citri]|jgi:hypothetical protein|uniref:hypothetical protein n=1 Tax=Wolbachia endosymbiont of Diaphorina citri TaxID=116598 RepID=UPI0002EC0E1A|nr:hypothetical protein [Wolbachia endosymbiont of Diaphorina citri]QJT94808.1 hypothetical protein HGO48_05580 [Wolbachia endosymbiont of Diaphorina citri]QJT94937.1 hypothetical protein HGO48_06395 [Wolbachia endosymbiont of Diaphorina citri]QJT95002.1 hypothetical protein HGO48_06850 [Wolbachia endosymbiont of Diaphorina citri]QJT96038.1 hypothetical protein HGO49_05540 [Wolbachia endosymbiont of Diaphorina citri]QJT96126.1 hypothetical protein HGO49_06140 [Wolbachia endosymbiont of Diaphor
MALEHILDNKQVCTKKPFGGSDTEEQHTQHFGRYTLESSASSLSQEQTDDWNESIIEDKNTVFESSFIPENSLFMNLSNLLTENEKVSINEFHEKMENIMKEFHENRYESSAKVTLEQMERLIDEYLKRKIKLNLRCDHYECTVSNFVFKKIIDIANASSVMRITPTTRSRYKDNGEEAMDEWEEGLEPLFNIVNKLLSSGAKIESDFYNNSMISEVMWGNDEPIFTERKKIKEELKSIAYEGLVNKNEQVQGDDLTGEVDNNLVLFRWPKNSIVEVAKVMNSKVNENFSIESSILQIGKSIIRVESIGRKRNYTDVLGGGIEMSFTTEVGKISIHLCPSDEGNNIIEVNLDGESQEKFDKLKDQSILGESCLLGGKSVLQAIKDKGFERNGGIFIELAETIKQSDFVVKESGVPSTLMRSVDSLDQLQKMKASKEILVCS